MVAFTRQSFHSLASSNNEIKHAIEAGHEEGLVVQTFQQTAGYGRLGRSWVSPFGGLYFSVLLRPGVSLQDLPTLGLLVALTMRRVLAGCVPAEQRPGIQIKWPNDVVLVQPGASWGTTFNKLVGISFERHAGACCLGIGVNVFRPAEDVPVGGKNVPAYVADLMADALAAAGIAPVVDACGLTALQQGCITRVLDEFLEAFGLAYQQWCTQGFDPFLQEYSANLCLCGKRVQVVNQVDECLVAGVVEGVDAQARLLLRTEYGTTEAVSSGEVRLA
ncbi:MAG: biotin--[acetyl-CoA-carboxylase] ligase [Coriobacteriia bacterium]|nr:biotin--[acetyl-CoA-carboxylase] ligase [Coriobacteriia bacterium]